jgi:hypothetical protein
MAQLSLIAAAAIVIVLMEVPYLRKNSSQKDLWVFYLMLGIGVAINGAQGLQIQLPNPAEWMEAVFNPLSSLVFRLLQ